jgi:hypothetical protein
MMRLFARRRAKPRTLDLVGAHIDEYIVAEPGCTPKVRVKRVDQGWALKTGALFPLTHSIATDLTDAIHQARKLSRHLNQVHAARANARSDPTS